MNIFINNYNKSNHTTHSYTIYKEQHFFYTCYNNKILNSNNA